jgi:putative FmdB family regulatory protein
MPLYEYFCASCGSKFEALRPMTQADAPLACPRCTYDGAARVISTCAVISRTNGGSRLIASSQSAGCGSCGGGHCATCHH